MNFRSEQGVTLLEVLIVMVMIGLIVVLVGMVYNSVFRAVDESQTQNELKDQISRAMEWITRDLRTANSIVTCTQGDLVFNVNFDTTTIANEFCRYYFSPGPPPPWTQPTYQLYRATSATGIPPYGSGALIATDLLPYPTSYFSQSGNLITVILGGSKRNRTFILTSQIRPRNLP